MNNPNVYKLYRTRTNISRSVLLHETACVHYWYFIFLDETVLVWYEHNNECGNGGLSAFLGFLGSFLHIVPEAYLP